MSKFNVGDKVKYIGKDHREMPEFYPEIGTIGTVVQEVDEINCYVQWPKGSTSKEDRWYCSKNDIELVENVDMTNEEIWKMLRPKMEKNGLSAYMFSIPTLENIEGDIKWVKEQTYKANDVHNAIALAYKVGYLRAMKSRPFKFGEKKKKEPMEYQSLAFKGKDGKWHLAPQPNLLENHFFTKKKSGHWVPVDPNNLPKEGTKVRYNGGLKGYNWKKNSEAKWIKTEKDRFTIKFDEMSWTLDCMNKLLKYFDMWVEDDE